MKDELRAFYDQKEDILYLAREGEESEFIEFQPGVNLELDSGKRVIGIEIMEASRVLREVIKPLQAARSVRG